MIDIDIGIHTIANTESVTSHFLFHQGQ